MIGSLTFTRDDGATFTFSAVNPPYQLTPDTQLPAGLALDVSGGEYTGRNGGYTLASRLQRRTAKIVYNVRETYSDARSMVRLLNDAAEFFRPMTADLRVVSFDMLVQTDDSNQSAYLMRHGHVTTPFMAPLLRGGHGSYAAEFDLIFDDPLLYWADGSGVVSGDILPAALPGSKIGEVWQNGLQVWSAGLSRWKYPDQGGGGTPQTVHVTSAYQVPVAFTITGQITNPKIVNSRNGSQWSWEGTIPYGCVVTVDVDGVATDWRGNRLLNTMGGLVAAPGDNTFTLTGSDLVLDLKAAWTGAANASASTLSQDGKVVATNLFSNPSFEGTIDAGNLTIFGASSIVPAEAIIPYHGSKRLSLQAGDDNRISIKIPDSLLGIPIHVKAMILGWDTGNAVSVKPNDGQSFQTVTVVTTFSNYRTWIPLDIEFVPKNTNLWINFSKVNGGIAIDAIGIYTQSDYDAMQALGITWFDGDSTFNTFNIVTAKASVNIRGAF